MSEDDGAKQLVAPKQRAKGKRRKGPPQSLERDQKGNIITLQNVTEKNNHREHPDTTLSAAVASMSFAGIDANRMCNALRISLDTLYTHYADEFHTGQLRMIDKIASTLAQRALAGSDTAAIFLLKTRGMGQFNDRQTVDINASVTVTHKAELLNELSRMLGKGITIDVEPEEEKPI